MKTAFTYWDNRIAPVLDIAHQIRVVESDGGRIVGESEEILENGLTVRKVINLAQLGVGNLGMRRDFPAAARNDHVERNPGDPLRGR